LNCLPTIFLGVPLQGRGCPQSDNKHAATIARSTFGGKPAGTRGVDRGGAPFTSAVIGFAR